MQTTPKKLKGIFKPDDCWLKGYVDYNSNDTTGIMYSIDTFYANLCMLAPYSVGETATYKIEFSDPIVLSIINSIDNSCIVKNYDSINLSITTNGIYEVGYDWDIGIENYEYMNTYDLEVTLSFKNENRTFDAFGLTFYGQQEEIYGNPSRSTWTGMYEYLWTNNAYENLTVEITGDTYEGKSDIIENFFKSAVSEGLRFSNYGDNQTGYVSGIGTCDDTDIVIPTMSPGGRIVTSIGSSAFSSKTFRSIYIPTDSSITSIGDSAFSGCTGLISIYIPVGVTSIGERAFEGCTNLKTICYTGTEEQWNAIEKGLNWDNQAGSYRIIYLAEAATFKFNTDYSGTWELAAPDTTYIENIGSFVCSFDSDCYVDGSEFNKMELTCVSDSPEPDYLIWTARLDFYLNDTIVTSRSVRYFMGSDDDASTQEDSITGTKITLGCKQISNESLYTFIDYLGSRAELGDESDTLIVPNKLFENAYGNLTLITENTQTDKNIAVHMNYLDIVKLNNPSNIKSGKTLFGITGTNTGYEPNPQAGIVIHDGYNTTIVPFYDTNTGLRAISWKVVSDKINFSNNKSYSIIGKNNESFKGLSTTTDGTIDFAIGETVTKALAPDRIIEYWVVYTTGPVVDSDGCYLMDSEDEYLIL